MPSRDLHATPPPPVHRRNLAAPVAGGIAAGVASVLLLLFFVLCFKRLFRKSNDSESDSGSQPPYRLSYTVLRRATAKFHPSRRLGGGGFGSVYSGNLKIPCSKSNVNVAVKLMDSGSLQGEREFQNELLFAGKIDSNFIVSVVGFSSDRRGRRMLLVYELMANGSLQDRLFHRKCSELKNWRIRFSIVIDIAKGLEYLHHSCNPPVIHGDIKPSNVLLDDSFNAKIGDFGLARVKTEDHVAIEVKKETTLVNEREENGSESVITTNDHDQLDDQFHGDLNQSPESFIRINASPESPVVSMKSASDGFDKNKNKNKNDFDGAESGPVKDYVMEWIGNEFKRPTSEWIGSSSSAEVVPKIEKKKKKQKIKKQQKHFDWWASLDEEKTQRKKQRRPAREWWKEEYCEELSRKKKKQTSTNDNESDYHWPIDDELYNDNERKKRSSSRKSSDLLKARRNSYDSVSSTPSTRGTVCYVAPEYGLGDNNNNVSEKCDIYSFGVLLLVLVSGRRPLQVSGSPMCEFQRANLLSWARRLARTGRLIELVDQSSEFVDEEQALLCITVALLCLQKSPAKRPSMKDVVAMLTGDLDPPPLPPELSPSTPPRGRYKPHNNKGH